MIFRNGYLVQSQWSIHFRFQTNYPSDDLKEFTRSSRARRRYWARSYAGWRRFTAAHTALASLEKAGRIDFMITQNVDRLHHRAGSSPLELHGTVYTVACLACGFSFPRDSFQDQLKALNPKLGVHHNLNNLLDVKDFGRRSQRFSLIKLFTRAVATSLVCKTII